MKNILTLLAALIVSSMGITAPVDSQPIAACQTNVLHSRFPCLAMIEFAPGIDESERQQIEADVRLQVRFRFAKVARASAVIVTSADAMLKLSDDPGVRAIVPDRAIQALGKPVRGGTSTEQVVPAGVKRIGAAPGVLPVTGKGIGVAIIDTGIDLSNRDLQVGNKCFTAYADCQDRNGHGTHVSGIVAAINNSVDVVGVAPGATVYAVKVLDDRGSGSDSTIVAGLEWLANNANAVVPAIRVANLSLGRPGTLDDNPILRRAFQALRDNLGMTIVVAAGNDPTVEVSAMVPATYPEVLAVASTTASNGVTQCRNFSAGILADTASYFTTDDAFNDLTKIGVTISAPGEEKEDVTSACFLSAVGILSLKIGGGTVRMSGTSMAAPHVSGVVALLLESAGSLAPETVRSILRSTPFRVGVAPLNASVSTYTFDGEREGILSACQALGVTCP